MVDKLTVVRLKNLADALRKASDAADRAVSNDPRQLLDPTIVDRLEQMEMEVGMVLADIEDGSLSQEERVGSDHG